MKQLIIPIFLLFSLFVHGQSDEEWCEQDFWKKIDYENRDTVTVFIDFSLCIKELPDEFYKMSYLRKIILDTEIHLDSLSPEIENFQNLEILSIGKSSLKYIPNEIGNLKNLRSLNISWGGQLAALPESIGDLENLVYLNLFRNSLTSLPESIQNLKNLRRLILGENNFSKAEQEKIIEMLPNCKVTFGFEY